MTFKVWYEESTKTNTRVFTTQEFYDDLDINLITLTELKGIR